MVAKAKQILNIKTNPLQPAIDCVKLIKKYSSIDPLEDLQATYNPRTKNQEYRLYLNYIKEHLDEFEEDLRYDVIKTYIRDMKGVKYLTKEYCELMLLLLKFDVNPEFVYRNMRYNIVNQTTSEVEKDTTFELEARPKSIRVARREKNKNMQGFEMDQGDKSKDFKEKMKTIAKKANYNDEEYFLAFETSIKAAQKIGGYEAYKLLAYANSIRKNITNFQKFRFLFYELLSKYYKESAQYLRFLNCLYRMNLSRKNEVKVDKRLLEYNFMEENDQFFLPKSFVDDNTLKSELMKCKTETMEFEPQWESVKNNEKLEYNITNLKFMKMHGFTFDIIKTKEDKQKIVNNDEKQSKTQEKEDKNSIKQINNIKEILNTTDTNNLSQELSKLSLSAKAICNYKQTIKSFELKLLNLENSLKIKAGIQTEEKPVQKQTLTVPKKDIKPAPIKIKKPKPVQKKVKKIKPNYFRKKYNLFVKYATMFMPPVEDDILYAKREQLRQKQHRKEQNEKAEILNFISENMGLIDELTKELIEKRKNTGRRDVLQERAALRQNKRHEYQKKPSETTRNIENKTVTGNSEMQQNKVENLNTHKRGSKHNLIKEEVEVAVEYKQGGEFVANHEKSTSAHIKQDVAKHKNDDSTTEIAKEFKRGSKYGNNEETIVYVTEHKRGAKFSDSNYEPINTIEEHKRGVKYNINEDRTEAVTEYKRGAKFEQNQSIKQEHMYEHLRESRINDERNAYNEKREFKKDWQGQKFYNEQVNCDKDKYGHGNNFKEYRKNNEDNRIETRTAARGSKYSTHQGEYDIKTDDKYSGKQEHRSTYIRGTNYAKHNEKQTGEYSSKTFEQTFTTNYTGKVNYTPDKTRTFARGSKFTNIQSTKNKDNTANDRRNVAKGKENNGKKDRK